MHDIFIYSDSYVFMRNGNTRYLFWDGKCIPNLFRYIKPDHNYILQFFACKLFVACRCLGIIALWIGFGKQSVTVTIVAAAILSAVMCQVMAMTLNYLVGAVIFLAVGSIGAVIAWNNLKTHIANMEV